jgi:chromosome partitioning protein
MGKVIAISNQKGGVGKTTTAINLSSGLARLGQKVLLIDFDSQGNASAGLHALQGRDQNTVYNVLLENVPAEDAIVHKDSPEIDVLPANMTLAGADLVMDKIEYGKERLLKNALAPIRDNYDYIFIDCPPSLGLLNTNALTAADSVLIPVQCEYYSLEGVTQLLLTIRLVQKTSNPDLSIEGLVMTMFDIRTRLSVDVSQEVRKTFSDLVFENSIPRNVKLSEAPSRGVSIFEYDPRSIGAKAYMEFSRELLDRNAAKSRKG